MEDCDKEEGKGEQREDRGTDDNGVSLPLRNDLSTCVVSIGNGKEEQSEGLRSAGRRPPEKS